MADDLNDVIERAAIDLQNMIDAGSIPEDDEGLYEAFGGKKGAGKVSVPKKLTDKQITAYFDFIGTPLTSKSEITSVVSAVRKNMTADVPTTESKKMAQQLTKNEQKVVDAFRQVQTNLFPDGNIPSLEEVKQRIDTGNYTIRDAFIAKMYNDGVPNEPLLAELDDTKEFYNKFNTAFSREVIGPARNTLGISNNLAKLSKKEIDLNQPFDSFEELSKSPTGGIGDDIRKNIVRPFRTATTNVTDLKLSRTGAAKGTRKLAKGAIPPEVLQSVLEGIGDIPDPVTRDAVMASLLGYRGEDLAGMRTSRDLAVRVSPARPYYDREAGISRDPEVATGGGRKGKGPDKPAGPVLRAILDRRFDAAGDTGELFPDMSTGKISAALKKHVFPKIPKEVLDKLLTKPSGYTDLRRITASAIANQLGRPDLASEIISHKGGGDSLLDKVMTGYYTDVEDIGGLQQRGEILLAYEKMMADAVGASDAKGLGEALRLDLPEDFNANYPETEALARPSGAPVETRVATPEEIAQGEQLRAAKTAEAAATAELAAQEKSAAAEAKMIERAERAPEIVEAERKLAEARSGQKKAAQVASGEDFLAKALKMAKPLKVLAGPLGIGMAAIAAEQTRSAVTQQAEALGLPGPVAGAAGTVAGATEFLPIAPSDVIAAGQSMASPVADPGSARPIERIMADQPNLFQNNEPAAPSADTVVPAAQPQMTQPIRVPDAIQNVPTSFLSNPERLRQARGAARSGEDATGFISYTP